MTFAVLLIQLVLAQSPARALVAPGPAHPLLDVPFVSQPPELCGGAAVSMVMRYWGQREIFPQDFAPLVSQSDGGIFTGVLAESVSDRGWHALVDPASAETGRARFRAEIDRGRPIIALIQVAPRTYHYVVIVGSTDTQVVFHDPARAPFRVLDWPAFDRAWAAANRWMMVALPPAGFVAATPAVDPAPALPETTTVATPCAALVAHAVHAAISGQMTDAEQELTAAMRLCPQDAAGWREMAGLRFSQKRYDEANQLATRATRLAADDAYSWDLAATSRYLMGDAVGALAAWNHVGQPKIDAINIRGAERTRLPVIVAAARLEPRAILTPGAFAQSLRRLRDLPVAATADMKFEPVTGGLANVDIVVVERPAFPRGRGTLLILAVRPIVKREIRIDVAGLAGAGESAFAAWRFATGRPRVMGGLAFPSPGWLTGVTMFSALWEQQTYAAPLAGSAGTSRETRRRAGLQVSDWMSGWLKWQAGGALDRFDTSGYVAADGSLTARLAGDRVAVGVSAGSWLPLSNGRRFATMGTRAAARSTADASRPMLSAAIEFQRATFAAPLALWPGAGTGAGLERGSSLRGHQLIEDGLVSGDVFGRQLVNGTAEYSRPVRTLRTATIALAGFIDVARASLRRAGLNATPAYLDGGVGIRVRLPGRAGGIRLDVAHRLGDGRTVVSGGWTAAWPQ